MENLREAGKFLGLSILSIILVLFILGWVAYAFQASAATGINSQLNYQGKLNDSSGVAVSDGTYNIKLAIYAAGSGGTCLWTAVGSCADGNVATTTVTTVNGVFSVVLGGSGQNSLATSTINWNTDNLYLGVTIRGTTASPVYDEEMTPRKRITSSAYAFNADLVDGISATSTAAVANELLALDSFGNLNLFDKGVSSTRATTSAFVFIAPDGSYAPPADFLDRAGGDLYAADDVYIGSRLWVGNAYEWGSNYTLAVTGDVIVDGDIRAQKHIVSWGSVTSTDYLSIGNITTDITHLDYSGGDLYVTDDAEIDSDLWVSGNATTTNHFEADSNFYVKDGMVSIGIEPGIFAGASTFINYETWTGNTGTLISNNFVSIFRPTANSNSTSAGINNSVTGEGTEHQTYVVGYTGDTNYEGTASLQTLLGLQSIAELANTGSVTSTVAISGQINNGIADTDGGGDMTSASVFTSGFTAGTQAGTIATASLYNTTGFTLDGGTITNAYGLKLGTPAYNGGTITNLYGIYIDNQNGATTDNYAIYTNTGNIRFGDDLLVVGNATTTGRFVIGSTNPTTNDSLFVGGNIFTTGYASSTTGLFTQGNLWAGGHATTSGMHYVGTDVRINGLTGNIITTDNVKTSITELDTRLYNQQNNAKEPTGFPNRTDTTITFNNSNRNLTISGTNFKVYSMGKEYTKNTESIQIANTNGLHYIYYDKTTLDLSESTSAWSLTDGTVSIATVYWNGTEGLTGDERHGLTMDGMTHQYLHSTIGTRYNTGLSGTFSSPPTFSVSAGSVYDEDIQHSISATTTARIIYRNGANMTYESPGTSYYYSSGGNIYYDNAGVLTAAPANQYVAYWIFATNDPNTAIYALAGQNVDATLANARSNNTYEGLSLSSLPFKEMKLLYRIILRNDATPYEEAQDLRSISNLPAGTYVATDHGVLTGLNNDDHTQYLLLTGRTGQTITDNIQISGNATTTGWFNVGTTDVIGTLGPAIGAGDLFVGRNATITANLNVSGYASTTNLVLADGASNLGSYYDLYVNSGNLFFNGTQLTGSNGLAFWQYNPGLSNSTYKAISPTSTDIGLFVTASSTIAANFRVDGAATTTHTMYVGGYASSTGGLYTQGSIRAGGEILANVADAGAYSIQGSTGYFSGQVDATGLSFGDSDNVIRVISSNTANQRVAMYFEHQAAGNQVGSWYAGIGYSLAANGTTYPTVSRTNAAIQPNYLQVNNTGLHFYGDTTGSVGTYTPTERFTILNTGNVGIGTTAPAYKLEVSAPTATTTLYVVGNTRLEGNATTTNFFSAVNGLFVATTTRWVNYEAVIGGDLALGGNLYSFGSVTTTKSLYVGQTLSVGTTTPASTLSVNGNIDFGDFTSNSTSLKFNGIGTGYNKLFYAGGTTLAYWNFNNDFVFSGSGKVGIGLAPAQALEVVGVASTTAAIYAGTNMYVGQAATNDDDYLYFDRTEYLAWDDSPGEFDLSDDLNIAGNATTTGNVYLGTNQNNFVMFEDGVADKSGVNASSSVLIFDAESYFLGTVPVDNKYYLQVKGGNDILPYFSIENIYDAIGPTSYKDSFVVLASGDVGINLENPSDDDILYFDTWVTQGSNGSEYLQWTDTTGQFDLSDDFEVAGNATTTGWLTVGTVIPQRTWAAGDASIGNRLLVDEDIYVGESATNDDDSIFFDGGNESIVWDDSPGEFDFSDDVNITGSATTSNTLQVTSGLATGGAQPNSTTTANFGGNVMIQGNATTTGKLIVGAWNATKAMGIDVYSLVLPNVANNTGYGYAYGWFSASDGRFKVNQRPLDYGLEDLMKLNPKRYTQYGGYIEDGQAVFSDEGNETIGLIAQEVYGIMPEVTNGAGNGLWAINYDKLTPVIIKSIQELATKVDQMLARLDKLDNGGTETESDQPTSDTPAPTSGQVRIFDVEVLGNIIGRQNSDFFGLMTVWAEADFRQNVFFKGLAYFNQDTAGTAIIKAGATSTEVTFTGTYLAIPKVTISPRSNPLTFFWVNHETPTGFRINLSQPQANDLEFNWIALAVKSDLATSLPPTIEEFNLPLTEISLDQGMELKAKV
ncbi:MAG: tail fiber domain-containing protein, partial [Patescibacteria group bacterium]